MPDPLTADAPAKVNLVLEVLGRRQDGYHELSTVMQKLAFSDSVTLRWDCEPGVTISGPGRAGVPTRPDNLAWRAAEAFAHLAGSGRSLPHIEIEKRIPAASGLGGGASDAATTLRLLARAWDIDDQALLLEAANKVGSDEAFFLGSATALVTGRGETVFGLPDLVPSGVVVFIPHESIENKTSTLFQALGKTPFDDGTATRAFLERGPGSASIDATFNAFERVAFSAFPGLGELRERIEDAIDASVRLSGAGPSLFWIGPVGTEGAVAAHAAGIPGIDVVPTVTLP